MHTRPDGICLDAPTRGRRLGASRVVSRLPDGERIRLMYDSQGQFLALAVVSTNVFKLIIVFPSPLRTAQRRAHDSFWQKHQCCWHEQPKVPNMLKKKKALEAFCFQGCCILRWCEMHFCVSILCRKERKREKGSGRVVGDRGVLSHWGLPRSLPALAPPAVATICSFSIYSILPFVAFQHNLNTGPRFLVVGSRGWSAVSKATFKLPYRSTLLVRNSPPPRTLQYAHV